MDGAGSPASEVHQAPGKVAAQAVYRSLGKRIGRSGIAAVAVDLADLSAVERARLLGRKRSATVSQYQLVLRRHEEWAEGCGREPMSEDALAAYLIFLQEGQVKQHFVLRSAVAWAAAVAGIPDPFASPSLLAVWKSVDDGFAGLRPVKHREPILPLHI